MTPLEDLEQEAASRGITTINAAFDGSVSFSLKRGDKCLIGVDPAIASTRAKRTSAFAHELGHCETGAFYNTHSPFDVVGKHEHRAWKWAVNRLIPRDKLESLLRASGDNLWEAAERLDVTVDMVKQTCRIYFGADV